MTDTLRMLMPQWQGGNNPAYSFGAELLAWLAPADAASPLVRVPVEPFSGTTLKEENGIMGRAVLLRQLRSAGKIIEAYQPDRIVMFGGDCLVSQAPIAYLNEKYGGGLGVLWLDAHPDVSTPAMYNHAHAMVLGNLLGEGDAEFAAEVKVPLQPELVMYGGLQQTSPSETAILSRLQISNADVSALAEDNRAVTDWIEAKQIRHLAIHFDLDVLDPKLFRSLLFARPEPLGIDAPVGRMTLPQVANLIGAVSQKTDLVGLCFAEHLPWDALNLRDFLASLPILNHSA